MDIGLRTAVAKWKHGSTYDRIEISHLMKNMSDAVKFAVNEWSVLLTWRHRTDRLTLHLH